MNIKFSEQNPSVIDQADIDHFVQYAPDGLLDKLHRLIEEILSGYCLQGTSDIAVSTIGLRQLDISPPELALLFRRLHQLKCIELHYLSHPAPSDLGMISSIIEEHYAVGKATGLCVMAKLLPQFFDLADNVRSWDTPAFYPCTAARPSPTVISSTHKKNISLPVKEAALDITVGPLQAWTDGTIRYDGTIIEIRSQLKELCRLFMENPKRLINADDIKDRIISADKRKFTSTATISKYVSELHNSLKLHFRKDVIFSQKYEGWHFDVNGKDKT